MRVITGSARGVRLQELEGLDTRPTTDRVKEGLFSAIQFELEGRRVLDLFAGTGQLGIEALSRGADFAVFLDCRRDAQQRIRANLHATHLEQRARALDGEALHYLQSCSERYGLIFLDPPYRTGLLRQALEHIAGFDICAPHGIIVAEHPVEETLPELPAPYRLRRSYRYGKIAVTLFEREGEAQT